MRYFYNKVNRYYYGIVETNNHVLYIQDFLDEYPLETNFSANRILENSESIFVEVNKPDPDPLEERYINATDRPSVDGFKYPKLGWWASFERLGVTSVKFPFEADLGLSIGSKVRLYDGREGK